MGAPRKRAMTIHVRSMSASRASWTPPARSLPTTIARHRQRHSYFTCRWNRRLSRRILIMLRNCRRLRVLTWHVHGDYLYYLTQTPFDFYLVTKPDHPTGYAGKVGLLPWDDNVHEVNADDVASREFDVILYQQRSHWERDRETL